MMCLLCKRGPTRVRHRLQKNARLAPAGWHPVAMAAGCRKAKRL
ncbi:hypothetical protein RSPO_c00712 [Ralstonia solanacearum Po82]|uniref:Uncharacterized protein n=1 Tax=Ralstonia solanacearum (strain Po82) TaxID=1031711 RepID=F6FY57_RALS8|nr:hypothetical protein RSPO_c00712 [Ralstonia solanacearum Po82]